MDDNIISSKPMIDIDSLNRILNKSQSSNLYQVIKFLGNKNNTDNYLLNDKIGNNYICKTRTIKSPFKEQTEFELSLYNYLSKKKNIQKYINPCIYHTRDNNFIYCIYPVIKGLSLIKLKEYLSKLSLTEQSNIHYYIIKSLLEAIGNIHQLQIAHNSINENNILIDISNKKKINIKLTNFNLGCGKYLKNIPLNMNNLGNNINNRKYIIKDCIANNTIPSDLNNNHFNIDTNYEESIKYGKKWDLWNTGIICLKLIIGDNALPWDQMIKSFNKNNRNKDDLNNLYITSIYNHLEKIKNKSIKNYIYLITKNLLEQQFENNKNPARYTLEKIIIYEKYK